jgi:hypothetical protein
MGHSMEGPGPAPCQRQYQGALHLASAAERRSPALWLARAFAGDETGARHATQEPSVATETAKPTSIEIEEMNPAT